MSLKGFHIVFVTVSTLLFVFLALWSFVLAPETSDDGRRRLGSSASPGPC